MVTMVDNASSTTANATFCEGGLLSAALASFQQASIQYTLSASLIIYMFYLYRLSIPKLDSREPPIMLPRIPFVGHLVGLVRNQSDYYTSLQYVSSSSA